MLSKSMSQKILGVTLFVGAMFVAQAQPKYVELPEPAQLVKTTSPTEVEVVEVFSYTCGHCYQLEAPVANWLKNKPEGVNFVRMQMPGEGVWEALSRTYFVLEALGKVDEGHPAMYKAIMVDKLRPIDQGSIANYLNKNMGIAVEEFGKAWSSFPVTANYNRALDLVTNQYKVDYTPVFIIDGKYLVNSETARATSYEDIVKAVDEVSQELLTKKQAATSAE